MRWGDGIDLKKIQAFVEVAERGTLRAAARALELPTSSVTRAIDALEGSLGVQLVLRSPRRTALTPHGARYYGEVKDVLLRLVHANEAAREAAASLTGRIRVTASPLMAEGVLIPVIAEFIREYPAVGFDIVATTERLDLVQRGIDLAIRNGELAGAGLKATRVGTTRPQLFAAPSYVSKRGVPSTPADLIEHDVVVFGSSTQGASLRLFGPARSLREVSVRAVVACDNLAVARRAILEGIGIGVVPPFFSRDDVASGRLVAVCPRFQLEGTPVWLVRPSHAPTERLRLFMIRLAAALKAQSRPAHNPR
jgi:DNA-binding transcriptional LysR family regulator